MTSIVALDFLLNLDRHLDLTGQLCRVDELGVDLSEVHAAEIELLELCDQEAVAVRLLRGAPLHAELGLPLLIEDADQLASVAAVGLLAGYADAEDAR